MSDIVERLRNAFPHGHENTDVPTYADDMLMHEAAAEIERLRTTLQEIADLRYTNTSAATIARAAIAKAESKEREYDPNVAPCDDAEFGMKP